MTTNTSNNVSATPDGCTSTDKSLSFLQVKSYPQAPICIFLILMLLFYIDSFETKYIQSSIGFYPSLIIAILAALFGAYYSYCTLKNIDEGELNSDGFDFYSYFASQSTTYNIPLSKLLQFRLITEGAGVYVEVVTTEGPIKILQKESETPLQRWLVETANKVLANLKETDSNTNMWELITGPDINASDAAAKLSNNTPERFYPNESIHQVEKPEKTNWNWTVINQDENRLTLKRTMTFSIFKKNLVLYFQGLGICLFFLIMGLILLPGSKDYRLFIRICSCYAPIILGGVGTVAFLLSAPFLLLSSWKSQQWTITPDSVNEENNNKANNHVNLSNFAYMEISKINSEPKRKNVVKFSSSSDTTTYSVLEANDSDNPNDQYQLVLFDKDERKLFSFDDLKAEEAHWLVCLIMPIIS